MTVPAGLGYIESVAHYVALLEAAGIRSTMDVRNLNPPCALIVPPDLELTSNCGGTAAFEIYCVVPGPANLDAWLAAAAMAQQVGDVIGHVERVEPANYAPDAGESYPSLRLQFSHTIQWP